MTNTMMNPTTLQKPKIRDATVRQRHEGKLLEPPMGPQLVKLSARETDGVFELIEIEVRPGMGPPLHIHPTFDESFYVLEGTLTLRVGDDMYEVHAGGSAIAPAGEVHSWTNRGDKPMRFLQVTAPGGSMEDMLEAFAARPLLSPEEMAQLAELYGTIVVGPPL
ncbi:MAG TPA: cupin domain-containing protein [Candidatus Thermoplasmatota archaeon]|nr:cupin domain-containing protein [Candidatus Thermoplasmatota archaeon]